MDRIGEKEGETTGILSGFSVTLLQSVGSGIR